MTQPELNHDAVTEILLRLPPDDPACLVRASLVCKPWCRTLTDPAFHHRYREFHRTPPLLGFVHSSFNKDLNRLIPRFVPTTATPPFPNPPPDCYTSLIEDCRHGRVLLLGPKGYFVVWDPITGEWEQVVRSPGIDCMSYAAAVLCATAGCDHRDCHGGPFLVLVLGLGRRLGPVHARVYSSKTRTWGTPVSLDTNTDSWFELEGGALIRDELYYRILEDKILEYDLGKSRLSFIDPPNLEMHDDWSSFVLMLMEDGSLGLVGARGSSLYLWSRKVKQDGVVVGWVQLKVVEVELEKLVPARSEIEGKLEPKLIGSAQGVDVVFMRTDLGVFMIDLKSGKARKVCDNYYGTPRNVFAPFMSFSTPGASPLSLRNAA